MISQSITRLALGIAVAVTIALPVGAQELNLYSSRHYDTDEALYRDFEEQTGIKINRLEGTADELIEQIKIEGAASPADVLITVDAGLLWRAEQAGIFQPIESQILSERIPAEFRHPDGEWFGFAKRARIIYYNKDEIDPALVATYEDLARPELAGEVCIRSSSNIYNLSLMAGLIDHLGTEAAADWAKGVVGNFARPPEGNDTAQIRDVAAGACGVSLGNSYYYVRLLRSDDAADKAVVQKVGWIFPNQGDRGAHVNISGAGVVKNAPNKQAAVQFLEYLASDQAQKYFAAGNNEYPIVPGIDLGNTELAKMGEFKADDLNVSVLGENQLVAQSLYDQAGWR